MWGRAFLETPGGGWSGGGLAGQTGGVLGLGRVRWALGLGLGPRSWAALVLLPAVRQHQGQGPCPHMWVVSLFPCRLAGPLPWPHLEELALSAGGGSRVFTPPGSALWAGSVLPQRPAQGLSGAPSLRCGTQVCVC